MNAVQAKQAAVNALAQIRKAYEEPYGAEISLGIAWSYLSRIAGDRDEAPWEKRIRERDEERKAAHS